VTPRRRTDEVVRLAVAVSKEISFFSIVHDELGLCTLLVRPFGRRGQGMWLRSVTGDAPRVVPPW
jgi:hypothetical protein